MLCSALLCRGMPIRVVYFRSAKGRTGVAEEMLELKSDARVGDATHHVQQRLPRRQDAAHRRPWSYRGEIAEGDLHSPLSLLAFTDFHRSLLNRRFRSGQFS